MPGIATAKQIAWPATGVVAGAITGAYVVGREIPVGDAGEMWLAITLAATLAPTTLSMALRWTPDGVTYYDLPAVNSVVGGLVDVDVLEVALMTADGTHSYGPVIVPPGSKVQVALRCTGGTAPTALVWAHLAAAA